MKQSRITFYSIALATLIFSFASYYYILQANNLGSNEASALLTKKTSIIDWDKFQKGQGQAPSKLVGSDTFLNYPHNPTFALHEDYKSKPSLYIRTSSQIYPIFVQTRTGALPHFITGNLARWFSPDMALAILPIFLSSICFFLSVLLVSRRNQKMIFPFLLMALTAPQFVYFLNPFFPDSYSSFTTVLCVFFLIVTTDKKKFYYLIGFLLGLAFYFKISSLTLFPLLLIFYPKKIFSNIKSIILGLSPFILFFLVTFNFSDFFYLLTQERTFIKHSQFNFDVIKYFTLYNFSPGISFTNIISLNPFFPKLSFLKDGNSILIYINHSIAFILFFINFVQVRDLLKSISFLILYIITTCAVVSGINEDLIDFMAQGIYLFTVILFLHIDPSKIFSRKKIFILLFSYLFIIRGVSFWSWDNAFFAYKKQFQGCVWAYDCMVKDWKKSGVLQNHQLITLYYLDVGQIEYFSQETIIPLHVNWKYSKIPTHENFLDFLKKYPAQEFFILSSKELGVPTDLAKYLGVKDSEVQLTLLRNLIKMDVIKQYDYPGISREYTLIKLSRI
jgi:hypothetical protein